MEDRYHSGYSPTVRPDLTHLKGAPDGTHHSLYELKVTSPLALSEGCTGTLGGRVGFGNTAEEQYEIILGTPPNAADGSPGRLGVYDDALRGGHRVRVPHISARDVRRLPPGRRTARRDVGT